MAEDSLLRTHLVWLWRKWLNLDYATVEYRYFLPQTTILLFDVFFQLFPKIVSSGHCPRTILLISDLFIPPEYNALKPVLD